ncbi:MAG: ABC transporter ATP-binding protein [Chloroflexi bacterium]|nr:ABC transporter ATP-binding protein [Chloroflexota bacterium]
MSSSPLVDLDMVGKRYLLGQGRGARGVLLDLVGRRDARRDLWALRDVSLHIERGEAVGLVGRNGAGKTTTLRLLAGISRPTLGTVKTHGRVASLLNVGAGFHPELTGRENVLLNGVILGLSRKETQRRYDEIVDFAGLDAAFMETPVKHYSSGMYARLAFAVAVHVAPDVLLVDEVLSVGDAEFQDRSLRRMLEFRDRRQAAVVFVSHNLAAVELMCPRAVWLERGSIRAAGTTSDVLRAYLDAVDSTVDEAEIGYLEIDRVQVLDHAGRPSEQLGQDEAITVQVQGVALQGLAEPVFVVTIRGDHGPLFAGNMHIDGNWPERLAAGPFCIECAFGPQRLRAGRYRVELKIKQNVRTNYFEPRVMATFDVADISGPGLVEASVGGVGADVRHRFGGGA